jgi:PTS system fructose-specific IIC component
MDIGDLLDESLVIADLQADEKFKAFDALLELMVNCGKLGQKAQALEDCIRRENYLSTGLENGLAVPHAKTTAVNDLVLAFGFSKNGIEFDSLDGKPAHFIFLLLSPVNTSGPHIKVLSQITRKFRDEDLYNKIFNAENSQELLDILKSSD